jgi:hypothetical protein
MVNSVGSLSPEAQNFWHNSILSIIQKSDRHRKVLRRSAFLSDEHVNLLKLSKTRSFHDGPAVRFYTNEFRFYTDEFRFYTDK